MRSGSTFVGEIFNNHPNAFYQFEPLHEFYQFGCDAKTDLKYESLLDKLNCQFDDLIDINIPWAEASENFTLHQKLESQGNFNFRYKSRRLCKPPFCDRDHSESIQDCKYKCANVISDEAENVCMENIPVAKTIRFCNLAKLQKMTKEKNLDPRFIFLVRDPRGILNSRIKIYTSEAYKEADRDRKIESLIKNMKGVCDNTLGNMLFLKDNYEMASRTM